MTQGLENFVSMAIQGTQVPMYTKHTSNATNKNNKIEESDKIT